jgi:hypothetical protein
LTTVYIVHMYLASEQLFHNIDLIGSERFFQSFYLVFPNDIMLLDIVSNYMLHRLFLSYKSTPQLMSWDKYHLMTAGDIDLESRRDWPSDSKRYWPSYNNIITLLPFFIEMLQYDWLWSGHMIIKEMFYIPIKLKPELARAPWYNWNIVECGVKHPKQTNQPIIDKYSLFVKKRSYVLLVELLLCWPHTILFAPLY